MYRLRAGSITRSTRGSPTAFLLTALVSDAGEGIGDAAAFTPPGLVSFFDSDGDDQQADRRVEPPCPNERVAEEAEEQRSGQVGTQQVLPSFALGRRRAELVGKALLGDAEQRHQDHARGRESDPDPALLRALSPISPRSDSTAT